MTKHGHIISEKQTTDPDQQNLKMNDFRGTGGVFHGTGVKSCAEYCFLHDFCKCINL